MLTVFHVDVCLVKDLLMFQCANRDLDLNELKVKDKTGAAVDPETKLNDVPYRMLVLDFGTPEIEESNICHQLFLTSSELLNPSRKRRGSFRLDVKGRYVIPKL